LRLTDLGLDSHLADIARLLDRYGVSLDPGDLSIEEAATGARTFDIRGFLPAGRQPALAALEIRETWLPVDTGAFERAEYAYELIDRERDFRRAFHLHFPDWFQRHFLVVVHEHCERPIGAVDCEHYEGAPIRDAFAGVLALIDVWTGDSEDCATLRCLE
jgi:hypothetical protein